MTKILTALIGLFFYNCAIGQITKGNWMMGGNGNFTKSVQNGPGPDFDAKTTTISLSPNSGYFLANQFAAGARLKLDYNHRTYRNVESTDAWWFAGPFVRYYILDNDRIVNFFSEAAFQFHLNKHKATASGGGYNSDSETGIGSYSLSLGTAIFLNSSVAIEGAFNYERIPKNDDGIKVNNFGFRIGFQIHLEKDSY